MLTSVGFAKDLGHCELVGVGFWWRRMRERSVPEEHVARHVEVVVGPKPKVRVLLFGRCVDEAPVIATKGQLLIVVCNDVLAQFRADLLDQIPEVPYDWEVPQDGMLFLRDIVDSYSYEQHDDHNDDPHPPRHASYRTTDRGCRCKALGLA